VALALEGTAMYLALSENLQSLSIWKRKVKRLYTLMDIIYHIAGFQKDILMVLTAFPLELKNK
jgi:hypothetical protein